VNKDYYSRGNEIPEGNAVKTGIAVVLGGTSDFAPGYVPWKYRGTVGSTAVQQLTVS